MSGCETEAYNATQKWRRLQSKLHLLWHFSFSNKEQLLLWRQTFSVTSLHFLYCLSVCRHVICVFNANYGQKWQSSSDQRHCKGFWSRTLFGTDFTQQQPATFSNHLPISWKIESKGFLSRHMCQRQNINVWALVSVCQCAQYEPVKVTVVVLGFTPEIEEHKTQEKGEDQEAKAATLHL